MSNTQDLDEVLRFAMTVLQEAPRLVGAGAQAVAIFQGTFDSLQRMQAEGRNPSREEWDAINTVLAELRKEFHAPEPDAA